MGIETVEEPVVLLDEADESEVHNEVPIDAFDELLSQQLLQVTPENPTQVGPSSQIPSSPHQSLPSQSAVSIYTFSLLIGVNEVKQVPGKFNLKFLVNPSLLSVRRFLKY
jgi:hypothetical protein